MNPSQMIKNLLLIFSLLALAFPAFCQFAPEDCANGLDDDLDGFTDLNDPDCRCKGIKDTLFVPSSLIPNPSFEDYNCCPTGLMQLNCSKNWIQASAATSDYFNTCGFSQDPMRGSPPQPLPAGNGYVGFLDLMNHPVRNSTYKEYVGACLTNTMQAGKDYTLSFWIGFGTPGNSYGPRAITTLGIFGTSKCVNLPFGGANGWLCPTNYPNWFQLTTVTASGTRKWVKVTVKLKPNQNIEALVIGPGCTRADGFYYFFIDELILEETAKFDSLQLAITGNPCVDTIHLASPKSVVSRIKYQWYKDGIALIGETDPNFVIPPGQQGRYVLRASDGPDCELSNSYVYKIDSFSTDLKKQICFGDRFQIGSNSFDSTGNYQVTLKTNKGCDSIVNLDLTVIKPKDFSIDTSICSGTKIRINNQDYDSNGSFAIHSQTSYGCDSITMLNLKVIDPILNDLDIAICEGSYFVFENDTIRNAGFYSKRLLSSIGCDSTVTIHASIYKNSLLILDTAICDGQNLSVGNQILNQAGSYPINLKSSHGCDSSVIINLGINPIYLRLIDTGFCDGNVLKIGNQSFDKTGTYSLTLASNAGCDSSFQIKLNVLPSPVSKLDTFICEGETFTFQSQAYDKSGFYEKRYTNQFGCDSSYQLNLSVRTKADSYIDTFYCKNNSIRIGKSDYNQAGDFIQNYFNNNQCDSIIHIHLSERPSYSIPLDTVLCFGSSFRFAQKTFNQSGNYLFNYKTADGCDSNYTIELKILDQIIHQIDTQICFNSSILINLNTISRDTTFENLLIASSGCDSILRVNVRKSEQANINISTTPVKCFGDANGQISVMTTGKYGPYKYSWSDFSNQSNRTQLKAGIYILTVTDNAACQVTQSVTIDSPPQLEMNFKSKDANCLETEYGNLLITKLSGGTPPYQISVDRQIKLFKDFTEPILIGTHLLELQDSNGCRLQYNFTIDPPVIGQVDLNPDSLAVILGDSVYLELHTLDIDSIASIEWSGPGLISCKTCLRTSVFINTSGGWFRVKMTDVNGCIYEESIWISSKQIYNVPNVFSPNGDNINDYFNIFTDRSIESIDLLQIFDRWGDLVYESKNFAPNGISGAWNGEVNGQKALPAVYVYLFLFRDKTGKHFKASGNLTLLR